MTVTASPKAISYTITYNGLNNASLITKPTTHTYRKTTSVGSPTKTGYTFAGCKANGGSAAVPNLTLGATAYTANITLEATWTANKYDATLSGSNVTASSGFGAGTATYKTAWTGTLTAVSGYALPDSIIVNVGSTTLTTSQYT